MKTIAQQTADIIEELSEPCQVTVLQFAEFLANQINDDTALYDAAKASDDGYGIS